MNQVVVFKLNNLWYGTDISEVNEIIHSEKTTSFPNKEKHIEGLINLRGNICIIVNGHELIGVHKEETNDNRKIIVLHNGRIGVAVDEVIEIIDVEDEDKHTIDGLALFGNVENIDYIVEDKIKNKMITVIKLGDMIIPKKDDSDIYEKSV